MRVMNSMHAIGLTLWFAGCVRLFKDGDGFSFVFRWWHPLTYVLLVIMVLPCAILGEKLFEVIPMRLSTFWRTHSEQLQWVTPFTRLDSLRPFTLGPLQPPAAQ